MVNKFITFEHHVAILGAKMSVLFAATSVLMWVPQPGRTSSGGYVRRVSVIVLLFVELCRTEPALAFQRTGTKSQESKRAAIFFAAGPYSST